MRKKLTIWIQFEITRPVAAIKSLRFALFLRVLGWTCYHGTNFFQVYISNWENLKVSFRFGDWLSFWCFVPWISHCQYVQIACFEVNLWHWLDFVYFWENYAMPVRHVICLMDTNMICFTAGKQVQLNYQRLWYDTQPKLDSNIYIELQEPITWPHTGTVWRVT